jgi:ATP-binding cassette subfamily B (MDR/TAP) protein 6
VLLLGSKACSIISPLYIGYAVDELVTTGNIPWKNIGLYVGISLLSQLIKQVQNALYLAVKQQAFIEISSSLLRHLLSLSHSYHHSQSLGKTVRGMDRALTSADNVVQYLVLLILPTFFEIIVIAIIFYLKFKSPLLAAIIFVHLTAYAILTIQLTLIRKPLRKRMTTQDNKFHSIFQEAMSNYDIVRSFNTEEYEISRYTSAVTHYQHFAVAIQYTLSFLNSVQQVVISSTLLCALFTTAWDVSRKRLTIGAMSSIVGYVNSIYAPLTFMGTVFEFLINSLIDCRYVLELRKVQPDIVDCENPSVLTLPTDGKPPVIEFKNVKFTYPSETGRGVRNLNFKFSGSTALVGSTGSGKSTIMRLLLRFYDPQEGEILINGHNIKHVTNQSLKDALCVIPQESSMFNTTILANLKYGNPDATVDQVIAACKVAEIYDLIASFPKQMETVVGESSKKLSGGEKQRLALARAILRSLRTAKVVQEGSETKFNEDGTVIEEYDEDGFPVMHFGGVILADEYTSALDSETEKAIQKSLKKLERGTTSVIIAHRLSTIVHCENIIVMGDGEILEMGTHQSLMELGGKYANLWNIQFDQSMVEDLTTDKSNSSN